MRKVTYLFESTTLWGGTKVGLEQAEVLSEEGFKVTILSKDSGPDWYPLKLPVTEVPHFDSSTIPESDIVIGTYWPTVKAAYEAKRGIPVHLCQGYEGSYKELCQKKAEIDTVYSLKIPKLTVSRHLNKFLIEQFNAETYYIGQMLNRGIFYPSKTQKADEELNPFKILVVGPFEVDFKNIANALMGVSLAKERLPVPVKLIRVSQFPLSRDEVRLIKPDIYLFHVPNYEMGEIYRNANLFISISKEAEGFGLPALEAMACGVPVILSKISSYTAFDEIQDYALFVEPSNHVALADAISQVFNNKSLRERLRQRGISVADQFNREDVLDRLIKAFEDIISHYSHFPGNYNNP